MGHPLKGTCRSGHNLPAGKHRGALLSIGFYFFEMRRKTKRKIFSGASAGATCGITVIFRNQRSRCNSRGVGYQVNLKIVNLGVHRLQSYIYEKS